MASQHSGTIYLGDAITEASDRQLLSFVVAQLERAGDPFVVLANCHFGGRQLDCIVATGDRVAVVEAKSSYRPVKGGLNGRWGRIQPDGSLAPYTNAYLQALHAKNALRDTMAQQGDLGTWYPDGLVVFTSGLPAGSDVTAGDYKVRVCVMNALELSQLPRGSPWSIERWRRFARDMGLTSASLEEATAFPAAQQSLALLRDYRDAVAREYSRDRSRWLTETPEDREVAGAALQAAGGCFVEAPSGCGKSLLARAFTAKSARTGTIVLFLSAKLYDGSWQALIRREIALLIEVAPATLYRALRHLHPPVAIVLDGLNELPDVEDALRGLSALAGRLDARLIVTSQDAAPIQLAGLIPLKIARPSLNLKRIIAEGDSRVLGTSALSALKAARSGFEARVVGRICKQIEADLPRPQLIDLYIRTLLGGHARAAAHGLRRLAANLHVSLAFSISETAFDDLMLTNGVPDVACTAMFATGLLVRRGGRVSFAHEILQQSCTTFALATAAQANPSVYTVLLGTAPIEPIAGDILAVIEDRAVCKALLEHSTATALLRASADGLHGPFAREIAEDLLDTAFADCIAEIEGLRLVVIPGERATVNWHPDTLRDWSPQRLARFAALGLDISSRAGIERHMAVCAAMDARLFSERSRVGEAATVAGCRTLRSNSFWLAYYGFGRQTGFLHMCRMINIGFDARAEIAPAYDFDVTVLTSGQLHFYLENRYSLLAAQDKERFADQLIFCLRERFATEPYHVKLAILNAAGFAQGESDETTERLIDAVQELDVPPGNLGINSAIIDALKFLGAIKDRDESYRTQIRRELAAVLADEASDAVRDSALSLSTAMFDHPYDALYYEEILALEEVQRRMLYRRALAAPDAKLSGNLAWLVRQVARFNDPQDGPIMQYLAGLPDPKNAMPQEEWSAFVDATRFLGRHGLPLLPAEADSEAAHCLILVRELVHLAEAKTLGRHGDAPWIWAALRAMRVEQVIGCLGEVQQALLEAHWSERFQPFKHLDLAASYPDQCLTLARAFLDRDVEATYFHAVPWREMGPSFAFHCIRDRGDRGDLDRLRRLTIGHRYARSALDTIKALDLVPPA